MITLTKPSSVCSFCYKSVTNVLPFSDSGAEYIDDNANIIAVKRFFTLLERFIREPEISKIFTNYRLQKLLACEDCFEILDSFCEIYNQLKYLELQLEWKLQRLVDIMKSASKVHSRVDKLRETFQCTVSNPHSHNNESEENRGSCLARFKRLRHKVVKRCTRHLSKSQPRVSINRNIDGGNSAAGSVGVLSRLRAIHEDVENVHSDSLQGDQILFGWVMSFAVVIALLGPSRRDDSHFKNTIPSNCVEHFTRNAIITKLQLEASSDPRVPKYEPVINDMPGRGAMRDNHPVQKSSTNDNLNDDDSTVSPIASEAVGYTPPCDIVHDLVPHSDFTSSSPANKKTTPEGKVNEEFYSELTSEGEDNNDCMDQSDGSDSEEEEMEIDSIGPDSVKIVEKEITRITIVRSECPVGLLGNETLVNWNEDHFKQKRKQTLRKLDGDAEQDNVSFHDDDSSSSSDYPEISDVKIAVPTPSKKEEGNASDIEETNANFTCPNCAKQFGNVGKLNFHIKTVHGWYIHPCLKCGRRFNSVSRLRTHSFIHKNPETWKFKCSTCEKRFYSNNNLRAHMLTHANGRQIACKICNMQFMDRQMMLVHVRTEHVAKGNVGNCKVFSCSKCERKFLDKVCLASHVARVHSGASYRCSQCDKVFKTRSLLNRHATIHSDPSTWKFQCSICSHRCYRKGNLEKHMLTHE